MKISTASYRLRPGQAVQLSRWPTAQEPLVASSQAYEKHLGEGIQRLSELQERLYAQGRHAVLIIVQAMDAAGKDSVIKHVMSGVNPQGCQVTSFKQPSSEELGHDFLWRSTCRLPVRGQIGIFNRSYYEEVLITRVHSEILERERLPPVLRTARHFWKHRYQSINDLESHLARNGTTVIKFFLHLSKHEQKLRFLKRLEHPDKLWKFSRDDLRERASWDHYAKAYEQCLSATTSAHAPWYLVPADSKKNTRLIISHIVNERLAALDLRSPAPAPAGGITKAEAATFRTQLGG